MFYNVEGVKNLLGIFVWIVNEDNNEHYFCQKLEVDIKHRIHC